MIGVDSTVVGKIVQVNDLNLSSINRDKNQLVDSINTIETCFQGSGIKDIFSEVLTQKENIKKIPTIVENYSIVLNSVMEANSMTMTELEEYFDYKNSEIRRKI